MLCVWHLINLKSPQHISLDPFPGETCIDPLRPKLTTRARIRSESSRSSVNPFAPRHRCDTLHVVCLSNFPPLLTGVRLHRRVGTRRPSKGAVQAGRRVRVHRVFPRQASDEQERHAPRVEEGVPAKHGQGVLGMVRPGRRCHFLRAPKGDTVSIWLFVGQPKLRQSGRTTQWFRGWSSIGSKWGCTWAGEWTGGAPRRCIRQLSLIPASLFSVLLVHPRFI